MVVMTDLTWLEKEEKMWNSIDVDALIKNTCIVNCDKDRNDNSLSQNKEEG